MSEEREKFLRREFEGQNLGIELAYYMGELERKIRDHDSYESKKETLKDISNILDLKQLIKSAISRLCK